MAHDLQELTRAAARSLAEATSKLGGTLRDDGVVALGWGDVIVRPVVLQAQDSQDGVALALGFEIGGASFARPLRDVSAGVALSAEAAIQVGLQSFLGGPLSVVHDALSDLATPYRYAISTTDHDTQDSTQWSVFESPLQVGGDEDTRSNIGKALAAKPLFVRLAEAKTLPRLSPGGVHWLRLHGAREESRPAFNECTFDGASWPEGQQVLAAFEWPPLRGPQTFRQYWLFTLN